MNERRRDVECGGNCLRFRIRTFRALRLPNWKAEAGASALHMALDFFGAVKTLFEVFAGMRG
jgi:hypothetical protein